MIIDHPDDSQVLRGLKARAQRGAMALSVYAPGRSNAADAQSLIEDIIILAQQRGWNLNERHN